MHTHEWDGLHYFHGQCAGVRIGQEVLSISSSSVIVTPFLRTRGHSDGQSCPRVMVCGNDLRRQMESSNVLTENIHSGI